VDAPSTPARVTPITAVIVTWNTRDDVLRLLDSLEAQRVRPAEVIVVDNGSTDNTLEAVRTAHASVRLEALGTNRGFAAGANAGIARANTPWIALLNSDLELAPEFFEVCSHYLDEADAKLGMVQPLQVFADRRDRINSTGIRIDRRGHADDRDFDCPMPPRPDRDAVFCASGAACLLRRCMLDVVRLPAGWFDPAHFMYVEDVDLGWRARLAGYDAVFLPEAVAWHAWQRSSRMQPSGFVERHCVANRLRTLLKNGSWQLLRSNLRPMLRDVRRILRWNGLRGVGRVLGLVVQSLRSRRHVTGITAVPRREVERLWMEPPLSR